MQTTEKKLWKNHLSEDLKAMYSLHQVKEEMADIFCLAMSNPAIYDRDLQWISDRLLLFWHLCNMAEIVMDE